MDDSFFNQRIFIRLSWCLYFKSSSSDSSEEYQTYYNELNNLINTTNLNKQILIHSLYYLYLLIHHKTSLFPSNTYPSFQSVSRVKLLSGESRRNSKELQDLVIVLLMISNKSHDDSSYTMKTWTNLTSLSLSTLKKFEIIILRKINYNVFLSVTNYQKWLENLYNRCLKFELIIDSISPKHLPASSTYKLSPIQNDIINDFSLYPLTPKSPLLDISMKRSYSTYEHHPLQPIKRQRGNSNINTSHLLTPVKSLPYNLLLPLPSQQPLPHLNKDVLVDYASFQEDSNTNTAFFKIPLIKDQLRPQQLHPSNCTCCAMTNLANEYSNKMNYNSDYHCYNFNNVNFNNSSMPVMMKSML